MKVKVLCWFLVSFIIFILFSLILGTVGSGVLAMLLFLMAIVGWIKEQDQKLKLEEERKERERKLEEEKEEEKKERDRQLEKNRKEREHRLEELRQEQERKLEEKRQEQERKLEEERKERERKLEEEREEQERWLKELNKKKQRLIDIDDYKYIERFVKKYKKASYNTEKINKLRDLISQKDVLFDDKEMEQLIAEELYQQNYEDFKAKMLYSKPKSLEEYSRNLLDVCGENYQEYLDFFKDLLKENKLFFDEEQIVKRIKGIKREIELVQFKKEMDSDYSHSISIDEIDSMTGHEFEYFLRDLFEKMGYRVEHTKLSADQGADLIIDKFGEKVVVQAKRSSHKVSNGAIQEVSAAIKHYGADKGMVVATNEFTPSAIELASSNNIELTDRYELEKLIRKFG